MKIIKKCKTEMVEENSCSTSYEFCCKQMEQVFDKKWKNSYDDGSGEWSNAFIIRDNELMIPARIDYSGYGTDITNYLAVKYCPFCGAKIVSTEYKKITETVDTERWEPSPRKRKHWWC